MHSCFVSRRPLLVLDTLYVHVRVGLALYARVVSHLQLLHMYRVYVPVFQCAMVQLVEFYF